MFAFWVRFATLLLLVVVCAPSLIIGLRLRRTAWSPPLLAVAALSGSSVYSQISLLGTPLSSRTWVNLGAAAVVGVLLIIGAGRHTEPEPQLPPPSMDPLGFLPADTRELIYRHPELLVAFERWHRNHRQETE